VGGDGAINQREQEHRNQWRQAREGTYLLRTNVQSDDAGQLWKKYIQPTEVEAAFRVLKTELRIRPLFHQLERRIKVTWPSHPPAPRHLADR